MDAYRDIERHGVERHEELRIEIHTSQEQDNGQKYVFYRGTRHVPCPERIIFARYDSQVRRSHGHCFSWV